MMRASDTLADSRAQKPKIFLTFLLFLGGGVGGADKKWKGNFWFCFAAILKLFNNFAIIVL